MNSKKLRALLILGLAFVALAGLQGRAAENAAVEARLSTDLKYLTSDECEGRGVTTKGINLAADYIAQEFKKAGLQPAGVDGTYFQPFPMVTSSKLGEANLLTLHGPLGQTIALEMGKGFNVVAFGGSGRLSKVPVVFGGFGITTKEYRPEKYGWSILDMLFARFAIPPKEWNYDDYAGQDVAGKAVIVLRRVPQQSNNFTGNFPGGTNNQNASLQNKAANAEIHKAAAVIFVNDNVTAAESDDRLMDFNYTAQSREPASVPLVHLRRSHANMMLRSIAGKDLSEIERTVDREVKPQSTLLEGWTCDLETSITRQTTEVKNVIGVVEGHGPLAKETIVIGAHYDHLGYGGRGSREPNAKDIHYGADDNASGTVSLIDLARRFSSIPNRQGRRLVFMAFTAEESGLLGSAYYCKKPVFPLDSTVAMVNMDMVGRLRDDKLTVYGTGTAKTFDAQIDKLNEKHQFKISKVAAGFGPSDHSSFYAKKIPVYHFFTGTHPEYHKPTDKFDTVNVPGIRRITDLIEEVVVELNAAEKRPEYVQVAGSARPSGGPTGPRLGILPDYDDEKEGVLLQAVTDGLPAQKAGLKGGDRIVDMAGKPVKNLTGYMTIMSGFKKGDGFEITVVRNGKQEKFKVLLE